MVWAPPIPHPHPWIPRPCCENHCSGIYTCNCWVIEYAHHSTLLENVQPFLKRLYQFILPLMVHPFTPLILVFTTPPKPPKVTTDIHITISNGLFLILILVNFSALLKHHQQSHYILISLSLSQSLCHLLLLHPTSKV